MFVNARGEPLSRWGFAYLLKQHAATAARTHPGLGHRSDGLERGDEPRCRLAGPSALARHETQADIQAGEIGGLAALSQQGGDKQPPEPRLVLQRLDGAPGLERDGRGERGWQAAGFAERLAPLRQPRILVPVEIIGERIFLALPRLGAGDGPIGARHGGVDGGQRLGEQRVVAILDDVRPEVRVIGVALLRERLRRVGVLALPGPPA